MEDSALYKESIIIDGLNISKWSRSVFVGIQEGGITAVNATVSVLENFRETITNLINWEQLFIECNDIITPVNQVDDIIQAKRDGKTGIILGFQNSSPIEDDLGLLSILYCLGIRIIQLTYMEGNLVGSGCLERVDGGVTTYGIEMIEEMNRLGILIDLSHVGYQTSRDAVKYSNKPLAVTHANSLAIVNHKRNKPDDLLKAVAEKGGVIGATIFPPFIKAEGVADLYDFINVIDYLVNLVGIDHVGVGTDFTEDQDEDFFRRILTGNSNKGPKMSLDFLPVVNPIGIQSARDFPNIATALFEHGYSTSHIGKIMGENFLRLFRDVW